MRATILLADSAQAGPDGKVHALGLGWSVTGAPTPPAAIVVLVEVPWDQCNVKHKIKVELVDADGRPAVVGKQPDGTPMHMAIDAELEAGRPPGMPPGSHVAAPMCVGIGPGLALTPGQSYEWRMEIGGRHEETWSARFLVRPSGNPAMFGQPGH